MPGNLAFMPHSRKQQLKWYVYYCITLHGEFLFYLYPYLNRIGAHAFFRVFKMIKRQYPCLVKNLKIAKHQYCREDVEVLCFASDINNSENLKTLLYGAGIQNLTVDK